MLWYLWGKAILHFKKGLCSFCLSRFFLLFQFDDNLKFISKTQFVERCVAIGDEETRESLYSRLDLNYNIIETKFRSNKVKTAHYTWWSFLPMNLLDQFRRAVNFYFLITLVLTFSIPDPPVDPLTWCFGFLFILGKLRPLHKRHELCPYIYSLPGVTMLKQGYEDYLRYRRDNEVNSKEAEVLRGGRVKTVQSQNIEVGDIILLRDEEMVPCDAVILTTSNKLRHVYVETSNLDGEANLKVKKYFYQKELTR